MGSGFENLILFGLLSLMLLIGTLLRAKVKLFQDYLVPASIIGGLIGFAIVSTGWLKIGEWRITSSSFNWFLFHAFNISYISLLLTRPRGNQENTSKEVVRGGMWQTLIWTISLPAQALIGGAVIWLYNLATGNSLSEFIGMIVTHGYTQGPGQAYAFGTLWEKGGIADCAVCYTIDPHFSGMERFKAMLKGKRLPKAVFTDEYFLSKAQQMAALGADMITIKDMSGLIPPKRVSGLIKLFKKHLSIPIDFHTHCTPGYGLASVVAAIEAGADIVDTNIWNFAGGPAAPAIELIWIFCQKMGVELDINMEAVAKINKELYAIRKELDAVDAVKVFPNPFNPLTDKLPEHIDKEFDRAVAAAKSGNEAELIDACHAIERYFNFPKPNELVQKAEIPGGMYTNMVAQLKQLKSESILESAMKLIPRVRLDAGLPPLVTPTSQIVGAQAVNCALDIKNGKPMYSNVSNQFVNLVKGEYGKTPVEVDPEFRLKIAGVREETPYDTSKYKMQPNPVLEEAGGVKLAENEKEVLLLELFPLVAKNYLTGVKKARYQASKPKDEAPKPAAAPAAEAPKAEPAKPAAAPITGNVVTSPMPGRILKVLVAPGDTVAKGQDVVILEAMKMENSIMSDYAGTVKQVLVAEGETVAVDSQLVEIE